MVRGLVQGLFARFSRSPDVSAIDSVSAVLLPSYQALAQQEWKPVLTALELTQLLNQGAKLRQIQDLMGLPQADWTACCQSALDVFMESVQLAPASEVHHHAFCGGLLVHTLDALVYALTLRRKYQLPVGAGAERVNQAALCWTYGIFVAVLLHDPGKVGSTVTLHAQTPTGIVQWSPLSGSMRSQNVSAYKLGVAKAPYRLHNQVATALFSQVVPAAGRQWLSGDHQLLEQVLAAIYDVHAIGAGAIGEILMQADGLSVARNLGQPAPRGQVTGASTIPLVDKYMRTLRQLLSSGKFVMNKPGAQVFVPRKKHLTEADHDVWIMCRAAAEAIVQALRQSDPTVPTAPERVYDTLQEFGMCETNPQGRAIWNVTVHAGDWTAEFSMLKFRAGRLFAATKVPLFAGSVKAKKPSTGAKTESTSPAPASNHRAAAPVNPHEATAPDGYTRATAPENSTHKSAPVHYDQDTAPDHNSWEADEQRAEAGPITYELESGSISNRSDAAPNPNRSEAGSIRSKPAPAPAPARQAELLNSLLQKPKRTPKQAELMTTLLARSTAARTPVQASAKSPQAKAAARKPNAPTGSTGVAIGDAFFTWISQQLTKADADINSPSAFLHVHDDGLLLVTPRIFKAFAGEEQWMATQAAVTASGFSLTEQRRHVHAYRIQDGQGNIAKVSLQCVVLLKDALPTLFPGMQFPPPNDSILSRRAQQK